jgi:ketosteroid isomerase-like protein
MSRENIDLVRRLYEAGLIDQDPAEWLPELATPDIEYVNPPYAVEPGVRRGPENVVSAMRGFSEVWRGSRHQLHELFDGGDVVVAAVSWYTLSRGSETELVQEEAHTWTIREGRIARFEWGQDLNSALRAAGLDR